MSRDISLLRHGLRGRAVPSDRRVGRRVSLHDNIYPGLPTGFDPGCLLGLSAAPRLPGRSPRARTVAPTSRPPRRPQRGSARRGPAGALVAARLAAKRSPHTPAARLGDLAQWAGWLDGHGMALLEGVETAAVLWARHLEGPGVKNSTAAHKLTAVSSFYAWCARSHVRANPVADLARPTVDYGTSATPGLPRDQAVVLLDAADAEADPQAARISTPLYTCPTGVRRKPAIGRLNRWSVVCGGGCLWCIPVGPDEGLFARRGLHVRFAPAVSRGNGRGR
jgi:hypothetical protein